MQFTSWNMKFFLMFNHGWMVEWKTAQLVSPHHRQSLIDSVFRGPSKSPMTSSRELFVALINYRAEFYQLSFIEKLQSSIMTRRSRLTSLNLSSNWCLTQTSSAPFSLSFTRSTFSSHSWSCRNCIVDGSFSAQIDCKDRAMDKCSLVQLSANCDQTAHKSRDQITRTKKKFAFELCCRSCRKTFRA